MGDTTKISWTGATWNPWMGCTRVSAGCQNCYWMADALRYGHDATTLVRSKTRFDAPLRWQREAEQGKRIGHDRLVFVCSWSDFWHADADQWRADAYAVMRRCPLLTFQIPTKRPERIAQCLPPDWGDGWRNVWLLASVENQAAASRVDHLLSVPAAVYGLSIEPLLGPVEIPRLAELSWCIAGGESGSRARPCNVEWIRSIVQQCKSAGVACFVKQLGSLPIANDDAFLDHYVLRRMDLVFSDRKGGDPSEWPADLRVRQMPAGKE